MKLDFNSPKVRAAAFQAAILSSVGAVIYFMAMNTVTNLQKQGIASGFGFLESTAGFDIIMHLLPYEEQSSYGAAFVVAVLNTLLVSGLGIFFATIIGFVVGIARLSRNFLVGQLAAVFVEVVRNIPLLLQLFFWYFAVLRTLPSPRQSHQISDLIFLNIRGLYLPAVDFESGFVWTLGLFLVGLVLSTGLYFWARHRRLTTGRPFPVARSMMGLVIGVPGVVFLATGLPASLIKPELQGFNFEGGVSLIPEFVALLLALSIYTAAFIAEIVRSGILAVSKGQVEAAQSLGLSHTQALRLVVIPQAMRVIIPPLTSQYLNLTKNSSLAAAIAYPDLVLVFAGTVLMQTGQAVEVIFMTMAVYLTISITISLAMNLFNRRMALVER